MATLAEKWLKDGAERGSVATAQEFLLEILRTRFQGVPSPLHEGIRTTEDVTVLGSLVRAATTAESVERFREELETARRVA